MKIFKPILLLPVIATLFCVASCNNDDDNDDNGTKPSGGTSTKAEWHLKWTENFNSGEIDTNVWSKIERGSSDWNNTMSTSDDCFGFSDGCLLLKGIVNPDKSTDNIDYITGGVSTQGKMRFAPGCIQVRARLGEGATGAWPAIWMMPFDNNGEGWPACGEIDIMERLNHDTFVHQTVHTYYTYTLGRTDPANTMSSYIDPTEFHIFEVQIWPAKVDFYIDHNLTLSYPKVNNGINGQFPFYKDWYLMLDMQLGGSWVGEVNAAQLPVEMQIDWVKYYQYY